MSVDRTLRNASISGRLRDLHIVGGLLADCGAAGAAEVDLEGARLIPGLHDHHIHLAAAAAAVDSVSLTPDELVAGGGLGALLRAARQRQPEGWLRGIGYDLTQSGWLDRRDLDEVAVGPVRIQDRTGSRWVLDSTGLAEVLGDRADGSPQPDGVERDAAGRPTGHLVRLDAWMRERLPPHQPDWLRLGQRLAAHGVTSVTDAGHLNDLAALAMLASANLPQRIWAMTKGSVTSFAMPEPTGRVVVDAVKIVLDDDALPRLDVLAQQVEAAHAVDRGVAVHCVTDVQLALALSAGLGPGDRVEHANVVPDGYVELIARAGVAVCVQPGLIATRGDRYLDEVEPDRHHELFRLRSLAAAGVPLLGGSDAPLGPMSPWRGIEAATTRRTGSGAVLGADEGLGPVTAAKMYQRSAGRGWPVRVLAPGDPADLLVLGDDAPSGPEVVATLVEGVVVHGSL